MSKKIRRLASIAIPVGLSIFAPGVGTALGTSLGATGAGASALGGALIGGATGALGGNGLSGILQGAALGGAGGYVSGGGLSDLLSGTSLGGFTDSIGLTSASDPITSAARQAISGSATATPSSGILSGYSPGGGSLAGGGSLGGFYANAPGVPTNLASAFSGGIGGGVGDFAKGITQSAPAGFSAFLDNPISYLGSAAKEGAQEMFSTNNILKSALPYAFGRENEGGYGALQSAGNASAANYQPFLAGGTAANTTLSNLYGLNGEEAARAATQSWQNSPGYQFAMEQGLAAIDAGAASRGMVKSGNTIQAEQQYGTGLAEQYYRQYIQDLQNQQQVGLAGAGGVGQGQMDAATAYAALKGQKANNYNQLLGSLSSYF